MQYTFSRDRTQNSTSPFVMPCTVTQWEHVHWGRTQSYVWDRYTYVQRTLLINYILLNSERKLLIPIWMHYIIYIFICTYTTCSVCEAKAWLGEWGDNRSMKNRPSTWQGGEDYQALSKLYLVVEEMERLFNDDR